MNTKMIQNVVFDVQQRARPSSTARAALTQQGGKGLIPLLHSVPVPQHKLHLAPTPAALLKSEATESQQMTNNMVGSPPPHAADGHASVEVSGKVKYPRPAWLPSR